MHWGLRIGDRIEEVGDCACGGSSVNINFRAVGRMWDGGTRCAVIEQRFRYVHALEPHHHLLDVHTSAAMSRVHVPIFPHRRSWCERSHVPEPRQS